MLAIAASVWAVVLAALGDPPASSPQALPHPLGAVQQAPAAAPGPAPSAPPTGATPPPPGAAESAPKTESPEQAPSTEVQALPHPLAAVEASTPAPQEAAQSSLVPRFATGFASVVASFASVPAALPRNKAEVTLQGGAGLAVVGKPFDKWSYTAYLLFGATLDTVSGAGVSVAPEQLTLAYNPVPELTFQAGYMRMPFSLAQQYPISNGMLPSRPQATTLFQSGDDAGFLTSYDHPKAYFHFKFGLFDGFSLGLLNGSTGGNPAASVSVGTNPAAAGGGGTAATGSSPFGDQAFGQFGQSVGAGPPGGERGPVFSAWLATEPLGALPELEADTERGKYRVLAGVGALYRPAVGFDSSGYQTVHIKDTRLSAALKMSVAGFFLQTEFLYALQTDDLSHRPDVTLGTYGQLSYYILLKKKYGLSPVLRLGWSDQDVAFYPLRVIAFDTGLTFYPRADDPKPGNLRITVEYLSEQHPDEGETAYGVRASGLVSF